MHTVARTGRQTDRYRYRQTDRQRGTDACRHREKQTYRETDTHAHSQADINIQIGRQAESTTKGTDLSEKVAMNSLTSVTASSRLAMRVGLAARLVLASTKP